MQAKSIRISALGFLLGIFISHSTVNAGAVEGGESDPYRTLSISCLSNVNLALDASGHGVLHPGDLVGDILSDCGILDTMLSQSMFDCDDVGSVIPVYITVHDACGNSNVCVTNVHVEDKAGPIAICKATYSIALDAMGQFELDPVSLDAGSYDNCHISLSLDQTLFTCDDIGTFPVLLYVDDGSNPTNACLTTLTVEDLIPATVLCHDVTLGLDETGHASISEPGPDVAEVLGDNCGAVTTLWHTVTFDCSDVGLTHDVIYDFIDGSSNKSTCTAHVYITGSGADEDCDSVSDPCDVCPFGDDRIDANGDGIPDCSQDLPLSSYDPSWLCGKDKVLACKLKASGSETKCIKDKKIADYLHDGDHIGPCLECPPGAAAYSQPPGHFAGSLHEEGTLVLYPNPVMQGQELTIQYLNVEQLPGQMTVYDIMGRKVYHQDINGQEMVLNLHVPLSNVHSGTYLIHISNASETLSSLFIIQ